MERVNKDYSDRIFWDIQINIRELWHNFMYLLLKMQQKNKIVKK